MTLLAFFSPVLLTKRMCLQYDTPKWDYPADPNVVDFGYPRGNARGNTTQLVAEYYGRLLSWLIKGHFVDEFGNTISGGPQYNLTHWEVSHALWVVN